MIKLYDSQITDLLPEKIADNIDVQCISYALQQETQRILKKADGTRTLAVIDELPEKILDVLAVELRTPYYQESMDIDTKRNIIKKTLLWHTKAGTPSAVSELIEIIFGEGKVVEWFDYEEGPFTPGTFDIVTNARMTEDIAEYFLQIIQRVKNTRSHIRRILVERSMDMEEYFATGTISSPEEYILNHSDQEIAPVQQQYFGTSVVSNPSATIDNNMDARSSEVEQNEKIAAGAIASPSTTIENNVAPRTQSIEGETYTAAVVKTSTSIVIFNGNYSGASSTIRNDSVGVGAASYSNITI